MIRCWLVLWCLNQTKSIQFYTKHQAKHKTQYLTCQSILYEKFNSKLNKITKMKKKIAYHLICINFILGLKLARTHWFRRKESGKVIWRAQISILWTIDLIHLKLPDNIWSTGGLIFYFALKQIQMKILLLLYQITHQLNGALKKSCTIEMIVNNKEKKIRKKWRRRCGRDRKGKQTILNANTNHFVHFGTFILYSFVIRKVTVEYLN